MPFPQGKRLLLSETTLSITQLNTLIQSSLVKKETGFAEEKEILTCRRCGTSDPSLQSSHPCAKCGKVCTYCRSCLLLGKVSQCQSLYRWTGPLKPLPAPEFSLVWKGELSPGQERASEEVLRAVENGSELLVWAVTGAGKTELLFKGIERALSLGYRILLAAPRVDVIKELTPRIRQSFPRIEIASLYGGSKDRTTFPQLILATTHQVMRYYKAFDVIIIDEFDAFPYSIDESLQYAISQAKKPDASIIYLTATPTKELKNEIETVKIPCRFHGYPLPVPEFSWCGHWMKSLKKTTLPRKILTWINTHLSKHHPVLLFVPTVKTLQLVSTVLQANAIRHEAVHASESSRHQAIEAFRRKRLPVLVTTTILERGVTFENVQVAVIGAEHPVFTEAALVQIAGRAGRSKDYPDGDVVFCHYGVTAAMKAARRHIEQMNEEGGG